MQRAWTDLINGDECPLPPDEEAAVLRLAKLIRERRRLRHEHAQISRRLGRVRELRQPPPHPDPRPYDAQNGLEFLRGQNCSLRLLNCVFNDFRDLTVGQLRMTPDADLLRCPNLGRLTLIELRRALNGEVIEDGRHSTEKVARAKVIATAWAGGLSFSELSRAHNATRERTRQIVYWYLLFLRGQHQAAALVDLSRSATPERLKKIEAATQLIPGNFAA